MIGDVEVRPAADRGLGVFARRSFAEGEFIFRRRHLRVVDAAGIAALSPEDRIHSCELGFDRFAVLAPPGCYLNHSCDPNAMRHGVVVFAWRPIEGGGDHHRLPAQRLRRREPVAVPLRFASLHRGGGGQLLRHDGGAPAPAPAARPRLHPPGAPAAEPGGGAMMRR